MSPRKADLQPSTGAPVPSHLERIIRVRTDDRRINCIESPRRPKPGLIWFRNTSDGSQGIIKVQPTLSSLGSKNTANGTCLDHSNPDLAPQQDPTLRNFPPIPRV